MSISERLEKLLDRLDDFEEKLTKIEEKDENSFRERGNN